MKLSALFWSPSQHIATWVPWLVLATGLTTTYFLQLGALSDAHQVKQIEFDHQAREIRLRIEQRLMAYENVLHGARGLYEASRKIERGEFHNYVSSLRLASHYPGIQGVGFSVIVPPQEKTRHIEAIRKEGFPNYTIRPEGQRDLYTSIIYLEPFADRNLRAFGYDMYSEIVRRTAMEHARDWNKPTISGKVRLVQETHKDAQAGFLMYVPVYRNGKPHETLTERRANIVGWSYSPFRMNDLMQGILGRQVGNVSLEIYDGKNVAHETQMYESHLGDENHAVTPQYQSSQFIEIMEHGWTAHLHSLPTFEAKNGSEQVDALRVSGILISLLLTLLVWQLTRERAVAIGIAVKKTDELRESEARWKFAIEGSGDGVWDWNVETGEVFFSKRWKEMLGFAEDEISGNLDEWEKRVHPDDMPQVKIDLQAYFEGKTPSYINEHRVLCKDGRYKWILDRGTAVARNAEGKPWRMIGMHTDMSERREAAELLKQAKEIAEMLAQSKSEFLANMSHEIRTPMNAIIGLSKLALNKQVSDDVRDYLEKISSSSEGLLGILNDILDFSKMEAGKLQIENHRFNLDNVLENLHNLFLHRAEEKYLAFEIEVAEDVPTDLIGDALRLQQIMSNLLGNAIKFTERGHVTIKIKLLEAGASQARLHFSVCDSGIGMSQEDQARLFQPFSQVDTSATRRFGGTGLGLAISRNLLTLMDSDLHVESAPGQGTTFSFELLLPITSNELHHEVNHRHEDRQAGALSQDLREHGKALSGARILVAEDNRINQQVVQEFLKLSGIHVDIANNGKEALALLDQNPYDAVLMDVHMPEMGGMEATENIRSQPKFKDLPVIALTAGVTKEEHEGALASGMNDFIAKPINPEALIETLAKWIQPSTEAPRMERNDDWSDIGDALPGFDFSNVLAMVNGNVEFVIKLLQVFCHDYADFIAKLDTELGKQDFKAAEHLIHAIKGAAGNLGAVELHAAASALDASLKQGQLDQDAYDNFKKVLSDTSSSLRKYLKVPV